MRDKLHESTLSYFYCLLFSIGSAREIDSIFSNVTDVMELTVTLITSLEDTLEMTEEGNMPAIGACFEELGMVGR